MVEVLPFEREQAFWSGVEDATRFFMGEAHVQRVLERLARLVDEKGIPYALIGAMALNECGYRRSPSTWTSCFPRKGCGSSRLWC